MAGRNINKLRHADDTTHMAESEEELKSLLMKEFLFFFFSPKNQDMASGPITSWQIDGEIMETVVDFIFLDSKNTADGDMPPRN